MIKLQPMRRADWPARDRELWERALAQAEISSTMRPRRISPERLCQAQLRARVGHPARPPRRHRQLDPAESIASRVAPTRLNSLVAAMREVGRENGTIRQYISCAHAMVRLLEPTADVAYMLRRVGSRWWRP